MKVILYACKLVKPLMMPFEMFSLRKTNKVPKAKLGRL